MKKLFKVLAAISLVALFMSCNITLAVDDNKVTITNDTAYQMNYVFVVPYSNYVSSYDNYYYATNYNDDLTNYLPTGSTVTIDLDDYSGSMFYLVFVDESGDRWALYVSTSYDSRNISDATLTLY